MAALHMLLWAAVFGIIAFSVHHELKIITITLSEEIFINAKRTDVYPALKDLKLLANIHPSANGLSKVVTRTTEDGYEETHFVLHEYISKFGVYDLPLDVAGVLREIQPGEKLGLVGQSDFLNMTISWSLRDHQDGVLLIDNVEYTGMRFLVYFALGEAVTNHRVILKSLKDHVEMQQPLKTESSETESFTLGEI